MWQGYMKFLSEHGWDVYAVDLRGHRQSGGELADTTMDDYADDVRQAVLDNDLDSPIIIGHSMGGLVTLMYARDHDTAGVVAIDPSPSIEVQGNSMDKSYKDEYTPIDAGMPKDPHAALSALPDIGKETLKKMKQMLGKESGAARSQRKAGVSVPKDSLTSPTLFVGGEHGASEKIDFGIGIETAKQMADYYGTDVKEVAGASHPGILIGDNWQSGARMIHNWLESNVVNN
jgi:pimeloyl-ACP methyl ester carboxylesterase